MPRKKKKKTVQEIMKEKTERGAKREKKRKPRHKKKREDARKKAIKEKRDEELKSNSIIIADNYTDLTTIPRKEPRREDGEKFQIRERDRGTRIRGKGSRFIDFDDIRKNKEQVVISQDNIRFKGESLKAFNKANQNDKSMPRTEKETRPSPYVNAKCNKCGQKSKVHYKLTYKRKEEGKREETVWTCGSCNGE